MSETDQEQQEQQAEIVDGEIVAEFDDHTLLNLPSVPGEEQQAQSASAQAVPDPGRRGFVLRLLLGSAAALALGGSAALIYDQQRRRQPQVIVLPGGTSIDVTDVAALMARISDLESQLAATTAERDQLLSDLTRSTSDLEDVRSQLADALALLDEYRSLNALWEQLDAIGLDTMLATALGVVNGALAGVMGLVALLRSGLESARTALDNFVALLPGPQDGIRWLQQQVSALAESLEWLAEQVQEAVEPVEPLAEMIASFVQWVLARLPFGIGAKAQAGLQAMRDVINGLPALIEGINTDVLDPLADWFGTNGQRNLTGILLTPIVENAFTPARNVLSSITAYETTYQQTLAGPVQQALLDRATIRDQIQAAQARLGLRT